MKKLIYHIEGYTSVYNPKTEEVEQKLSPAIVTVECSTKAEFDILYATAEKEAVGEILVEGEFEEIVSVPSTEERVEALEAAVTMLCMPDVSEV